MHPDAARGPTLFLFEEGKLKEGEKRASLRPRKGSAPDRSNQKRGGHTRGRGANGELSLRVRRHDEKERSCSGVHLMLRVDEGKGSCAIRTRKKGKRNVGTPNRGKGRALFTKTWERKDALTM